MTYSANKLNRLGSPTHDKFPITKKKIYGPVLAQKIANSASEVIADSYTWFANEAFWTAECSRQFGKPQEGDDKDPNCDNEACEDLGSSDSDNEGD